MRDSCLTILGQDIPLARIGQRVRDRFCDPSSCRSPVLNPTIGKQFSRGAVPRYGAKIGLNDARINAIENIFLRSGSVTVVFARFFNILRQFNGIVAGILGMSWQLFTFQYTASYTRSTSE